MIASPPEERAENSHAPRSLRDALHPWTILFLGLACMLLYQILAAVFWHWGHLAWGLVVAPVLGILLPVWIILRRMGLRFGRELGLGRLSRGTALRVVWILAAALPVAYALSHLNQHLATPDPDQLAFYVALVPHDVPSFVLGFLAVVVVAPLAEEVVFRGLALPVLRRRLGRWPAILLTGVLFGIAHGVLWIVLPITFLGILLGMLVDRTGSLTTAWLGHALFNLAAFTELCLTRDASISRLEDWSAMPLAWGTGLLLLTAGLAFLAPAGARPPWPGDTARVADARAEGVGSLCAGPNQEIGSISPGSEKAAPGADPEP